MRGGHVADQGLGMGPGAAFSHAQSQSLLPILTLRHGPGGFASGACTGQKRAREVGSTSGGVVPPLEGQQPHQHEWRGHARRQGSGRPAKNLCLSTPTDPCSDLTIFHGAHCSSAYGAATACHVAARQETVADLELICDLEAGDTTTLRVPAVRDASLRMPPGIPPSPDASASLATAAAGHHDRSVPTAIRIRGGMGSPVAHPYYPISALTVGPGAPQPRVLADAPPAAHTSGTPSSQTFPSLAKSRVRGERGGGRGTSAATERDAITGSESTSYQIVALQKWVLRTQQQAREEGLRADRLEQAATQLASQLQNAELQFVSAVQLALRLSDRLKQAHALNAMLAHEPAALKKGGVPREILGGQAAPPEEVGESFCQAESCGSVPVQGMGARGGGAESCLQGGQREKPWGEESANRSEDTEKYAVEILAHEDRLCLECKDSVACTVALPCRHLTLCKGCSKSAVECPKCLGTVHSVLHIEV